jgi:Flp pilus assembly protein TadD/peroxiredoxin
LVRREAERKESEAHRLGKLHRRDFIIKSCEFASAAFLPSTLKNLKVLAGQAARPGSLTLLAPDYRLTPHYRQESPLNDVFLNVHPGRDNFITEKYAEEIEAVLAKWSHGLRQSPADLQAFTASLSENLRVSRLRPTVHQALRPMSGVEVYRNQFSNDLVLDKQKFVPDLGAFLGRFSRLQTAEFKVTGISTVSASSAATTAIRTRVRYDLVGSGTNLYRGQRVGHWNLEWERDAAGDWKVQSWQALEETESLTSGPVFVDVTETALGATASYRDQLLYGTDYWRTVIDGASRIDVYGHNGVAVGDVDGDGFDDIYVCQPSGLPNRLYRNRGDGTFEDVTQAAGVGVLDDTACALLADLDNDGHQDLIVISVDGPLLFLNQGGGHFRFKPDAFRFAKPPQGSFTGAALADYDRDGRLDVYFCLYSYYQGLNQYQVPTPYYDARNGPSNFLLHNNGDGTFTDVTEQSGVNQNNDRFSFTCGWTDYNHDGWPDLYVVNDFGRKNLYRNNGNGTFTDVAGEAGVDDVGAGMSVCWFDYDNDGSQDLYVADMWSAAGERVSAQEEFLRDAPEDVRALLRKHARGNSLFHNQGDGRFADRSASAGVEMGRWSWSSDTWDFDHDGHPDLYIANGMISGPDTYNLSSFFWRQVVAETPAEAAPARKYEQGWNAINELIRSDRTWAGYERNTFYANNGDGTFSDLSGTVGLDFLEDSRTFALADFDHDGRLEVFLKNRNAPQVRVLKNQMRDLGASIAIRLRGVKSNRDGIGAAITVTAGPLRQVKYLQAGSGFLCQHTKDVFFGLGTGKGPVRVTVRWPGGDEQHFDDVPAQHRVLIEEGVSEFRAEPFRPGALASDRPGAAEPLARNQSPSAPQSWLLVPVPAPNFSIPDLAGQPHTLQAFLGEPVLLNFWAVGSPTSVRQLELLDRRLATGTPRRLKVVAVNVDEATEAEKVRAFAHDRRLRVPILLAPQDTAAVYNILYRYLFDRRRDLGVPTSFLLDSRGFIVKVYQGAFDPQRVEEDARSIPSSATERMKRALPFPGDWYGGDFHRNQFTHALVFLERGYLDEAMASCRLVVDAEPDDAEAYYLLGAIYLKKQMPEEARASFERTLKLKPGYFETWPDAWNNLGMLSMQEGRADEALKAFESAIRLNPNHVIALENLGNAYKQQGRLKEAQSTLELALKIDPEDAEANYSLGMVFAQGDDTARAYDYLQRALKLRPDYPEALNNLGILYARTHRLSDAMASFEKCMQVAPAFDQPYLNLARAYAAEGELEKARAVLQKLLEQHPGHELAKRALAELGQR